jgi:3-isopropylmalate/(R)-2-methylmalate dehydratase large subunit
VTAKDLILAIIRRSASAGGVGHVIEYRGEAIRASRWRADDGLQHVDRGGARAGLIAPDETTFAYLEGPPARAAGRGLGRRARLLARAPTDEGATFDRRCASTPSDIEPTGHVGHDPGA